jgi:hypothetical protein
MLELGMIICLALMGIYFFKSTDLPKELKERSARHESSVGAQQSFKPKMSFPKDSKDSKDEAIITGPTDEQKDAEAKLHAMKYQKKLKDIAQLQIEIDQLTLEITTLEQQIKNNNAKNAEVQQQIELRLVTLMELQMKITSLA